MANMIKIEERVAQYRAEEEAERERKIHIQHTLKRASLSLSLSASRHEPSFERKKAVIATIVPGIMFS